MTVGMTPIVISRCGATSKIDLMIRLSTCNAAPEIAEFLQDWIT